MAQRSLVFISSQGLIPLLYNIASPPCWRPTWRKGFWSFRFLILKQRAIRAQIFVDLPRNSSLLLCLSLQLESNSFYGIHSICLMLPRSYQNSRLLLGDGIFLSHFPLVDTLRGKQWPIMGSRHKLTSQSVASFGHIARHWHQGLAYMQVNVSHSRTCHVSSTKKSLSEGLAMWSTALRQTTSGYY